MLSLVGCSWFLTTTQPQQGLWHEGFHFVSRVGDVSGAVYVTLDSNTHFQSQFIYHAHMNSRAFSEQSTGPMRLWCNIGKTIVCVLPPGACHSLTAACPTPTRRSASSWAGPKAFSWVSAGPFASACQATLETYCCRLRTHCWRKPVLCARRVLPGVKELCLLLLWVPIIRGDPHHVPLRTAVLNCEVAGGQTWISAT